MTKKMKTIYSWRPEKTFRRPEKKKIEALAEAAAEITGSGIRGLLSFSAVSEKEMAEINEALAAVTERLDKAAPAEESDEQREHSGSFLVRQATAYIESHYAEKLTLQEVADACFVSQWHLSKLLNKHTDGNFYDVLNAVRINAAKRLLRDPSLKIGEIGGMVGYADTAHFARVFKKLTGMSANEYRNRI